MTEAESSARLPRGTVALPAASIGVLSLALAVGFQAPGWLGRVERGLLAVPGKLGLAGEPTLLPQELAWTAAAGLALVFPWLILQTPAHWRRIVLWLTVLALLLGWVPVMALAERWCPLAPSLVVVLWGGLCALIYAARHRMPCEGSISRTNADD
jgi:hypothetical protein